MEIGAKSRTLSYAQCIMLIQQELNEWEHGRMAKWCKENDLTYNTVVNIKTNRIDFFAPKLIPTILTALGYQVYQVHSVKKKRKPPTEPTKPLSQEEELDALVKAKIKELEDRKFTTMYIISKPGTGE